MTEINNLTGIKIKEDLLIKASDFVLNGEGLKVNLSIALVGPRRIKRLNRDYRKKNAITDVLSFEDKEMPEVVLCLKKIRKNAKMKKSFERELIFCLIHGILHIAGYDHEKGEEEMLKMQGKEQYYLSKIFS